MINSLVPFIILFSDDSQSESRTYNSYAIISMKTEDYQKILEEIKNIILESGILSEYKWEKVKSAKYKFASEKIIDFVFKHQNKIKIDVLIWSKNDSRREGIRNIDKPKDKRAMYRFNFKHVLERRYPENNPSSLFADKQEDIDFRYIGQALVKEGLNVQHINTICSSKEPFIQIADLFAGIVCFSHEVFDNKIKLSKSNRNKFKILFYLNNKCKGQKLRISLRTFKGLRSLEPSRFINFWRYEPQGDYDKAPTKLSYHTNLKDKA